MKKIYMILAAITLLSMSLNAQTRAVETNTYTYTLPNSNAFSTSGGTATLGDFTWTYSSFTYKGWENTRGMQIGSRNNPTSTFTLSTSEIPGTITSITVGANAYSSSATIRATVGGAAFGSTQNLSSSTSSAGTNTFTGSASGEIVITWTNVNNGRAMYFKSIEVTYETEAGDIATLDLFSNTTDANMCLPVYGGYHDHTQHNQMVYPASLLTDMVGKKIKSMTFYPASVTYNNTTYSGIGFRNGSVTFKLMEVTNSTGFDSSNPSFITGSMTTVKTVTMPSSAQTSATTWKITFDQEYEYNGGDLVIDVTNATGDYQRTYFYTGTTSIAYPGYYTYSGSEGNASVAVDYVPKVTFTYDNTTTASIAITPETQTINGETTGSLTVTGTDIEGNISVSAGTDWSLNPTSLINTGGSVSVSYTGTDLSASTTVTASATGATDATATVDYVADLYIVTDNGVTDNWDFTNGTHMTYNNGVYTATFTATADNTYILFARMLGNNVTWNTRYVFGPDSNGDWWLNGDSGDGTIDTNDDDPIKIVNSGIYTVTINANDGTFTITKVKTADPVITYTVNGDNVVITATGDGTVTLTANGQTVSGNGSASITVPRTNATYSVTATAYAQETGKAVSNTVTENITIPLLQTATPTITYVANDDNDNVVITATGDGTVTLTVGGQTVSGEGSASITIPYGMTSNTVTATATAQQSGMAVSETATQQITIPAATGWIEMDGTYNNPNTLLSFEKDGEEIMLIDQFLASTLKNDHPDGYTYTLREIVNREEKSSSPVNIPVYKTGSKMNGFYTKGQVDTLDLKMGLKAQVINSEMCNDVDPDHNTLYHSLYRSDKNGEYPVIDVPHRVSQLQKYEVNENNTVQYYFTEMHTSGVTPRYDHVGRQNVERLDTNYVQGVQYDSLAYVPVIWTFGLYTGREDGKNNSYGSDIKREYLGGVSATITGEKSDYSSWGMWTANGVEYCVYTPVITITGMPPAVKVDNDGDVSTYVPYMYRAWCLYEGAHDFVRNSNNQLIDNGVLTAPILLDERVSTETGEILGGPWTPGTGRLPWAFGIPVSEDGSNVTFAIRFYYKKVVTEASQGEPNSLRDGEEEEYYIVECEGDAQGITTAINELFNGRVPVETIYYNSVGMQSSEPFDGINIVVTRYSDGTSTTTKVMR